MYHQRSLRSGFLRALAALVLALVTLAGSATAATLTVTTTADSGAGSLPAQIAAAASGDTIVFAPNLSGQTITLTSGTLYISKNLTIDGSALASPIQISGINTYQVFYIYGECTVAFSHLGIVHGRNTESYGGGIRNTGTLTLTACTLSDNTARNGGGLQNEGTATLTACTFSRNSATIHPNYGYGGGINNSGGTLTLTSCTLFGNSAGDQGGAINNDGGAINNAWLTLTSCTLFDNTAERGGGICNFNLTAVIRSSIVAGNKATLAYPNFEGSIASQGFNLSDNWATYGTIALAGSDLTIASANLKLDGLAGNGGPTKTCALLAGSAAINAGDPGLASGTDQRGVARPQGTGPDIGAFEYDSTAPAFTAVSLASNNASPALARLGDTLTLTLTASEVLRAPTVTIAGQIATVTGSGTSWLATTTVASGTTEGVAAISILFTDLSGNVGTVVTTTTDSSRVTIDTTVPAAPVFTTASGTTSDTTPTLAGTAEPGITVTLHDSLSLLGTTTADSAGVWSFTPGTAWGDGTHFLLAFATDAAGNESNDFAFLLLTIGASAVTTPGAPTAVTAVDGNGFATVSFTAPSIQGAATISSYTVTAWSGGVAVTTATGTTSPITVTGLTNGTSYTFTVAATNSFGTGTASAASNAVTPAIHPRVVTTTADNGTGSLRQAIADTTIAGDPIIFAPGLAGQTITLTSGQLTIAKNLTIDGSALAIPVTISGNSTSRVFHVGPGSIVAFSHLGIVHGSVPAGESGGGIHNEGTLALTACTLSENLATDNGGGIANTGTLTLSACTVSGNSAHDFSTSTDSSQYSQGGGIHNSGTLALTACTLAGNSAQDRAKGVAYGGGIYNSGSLTLTACTLSGNSAAESSAGFGGGILTSGGTLTLTACTLVGNSTNGTNRGMGGGIFASGGTLTLTACTLTGNSAGGTILSGGGGIYSSSNGVILTLSSSIVAGNTATLAGGNFGITTGGTSTLTSQGYNLSDNWGPVATTATDLTTSVAELRLGALADNGGPTKTCALLPGSAATDAGASSTATDQRGLPRFGAPDLGAFESQGFTLSKTSGDNQNTPAGSDFATPLTVTVTANNPDEPVDGGVISFSAPSSGAGATLALPTATISSGAASTTATANLSLGSYAVAASLTGAANVSFTLTNTAGIPNPPTGISAVAGDGRAIVSFTPPVNNGGDTITSYTVTAYLNGVATGITSTGTGSPLTITGLANGVAYTFVVTATNTIGTSVGSTASTAVTPAPRTTAIVRTLPGPLATASTLTWRVLFVQPVASAIGTADFALTTTSGSATGTIASVVADATRTRFDVTATAVSGEGTLRLDIVDRGGLLAGFARGQSYTIVPGVVPVSWGYNDCSQLGDASTTNRSRPVVIPATGVLFGKTVVAASVGGSFTLALCSDGTIAAWGKNDVGQLGNGSTCSYSATPVAVSTSGVLGSRTVVALAAGADFALALCSDGTLAAWGHNNAGQLGNATNVNSAIPVAVSTSGALSGKAIASIAAGDAAGYAVCSDGTVAAWGRGDIGQLGNGANTNSNIPVAVSTAGASALNGKTVVALAAGSGHTVASCSDGSVAAWGWNYAGQLGNGTTTNANLPVAVTTAGTPLAGEQVVSVACGYSHSMALTRSGGVYGWGQKLWGSLGNGQTAITHPPVETPLAVATNLSGVLAARAITELTAGTGETLVRCADGGLAAWGIDHVGQLGDGGATSEIVNWAGTSYPVSSVPVAVDSGAASALAGRFTYSAVSGPAGYHHLALAAPLTVMSVTVPAADIYLPNTALKFTVTFAQPVTVDTAVGTPRLVLNIGDRLRYAPYSGGSGTSTLQFSYTVQADDLDLDGIVISGIDLNFGSFTDSSGWRALPALRNIGDTSGVLVAPQVNYDTWAAAAFTAAELGNPAISGPDADPDGSGVKNLMRYALELPARGPVSVPTTVTYAGGSNPALTLSFVMRAHGNDLRYAVMASEDLVTWTEKRSDSPYGVRLAIDASVPVPVGAKRFFLRLEIVTK